MVGQAFPQWGETYDMELAGNILFAANRRLDIVDASDPGNPEYLWFSNRLGSCYRVEVDGPRAFLATSSYSRGRDMFILDISDLSNPRELGVYSDDLSLYEMIVKGNIAYLRSRDQVQILDVTTPDDIRMISTIDITDDMITMDDDGEYIFGCTEREGIRVFDVSDPSNPHQINFFPLDMPVEDISYADDRIYLANSTHRNFGVTVLDVRDVMNIDTLRHVLTGNSRPLKVSARDTMLFVSTEHWIYTYSIADIDNPFRIGNESCEPILFKMNDSLLFVRTEKEKPLSIFNYRNPDELVEVGGMNNAYNVDLIKFAGDRMYVDETIFDISRPLNPRKLGSFPISGVIDYEINDSFFHVIIEDRYKVFDVADPANIELRAVFGHTGQDLILNGDYTYISSGSLEVLDASDLGFIRSVNSISSEEMTGSAGNMIIRGNYLYSVSKNSFGILDVSEPESPMLTGSYDLSPRWMEFMTPEFVLYDDYAYIAAEKAFYILDITELDNPVLVSDSLEYRCRKIIRDGDHLLLSGVRWDYQRHSEYGLQILSLEDPTHPNIAGFYQTPGLAEMSGVRDGLCYVADGSSIVILDFSEALSTPFGHEPEFQPSKFFLTAYPNPFNSTTTINFNMPGIEKAELRVYDLQGRLVHELVNCRLDAGEHNVRFDASGLVSGVYLMKLECGSEITSHKHVVLN